MANFNNQQAQNAFKNDGSFLEVFKRFQQQQQTPQQSISEVQFAQAPTSSAPVDAATTAAATTLAVASEKRSEPLKILPIIGKRKNKALKTGIVKKIKPDDDKKPSKSTDAWSLYLEEVKRYQETVGEQDNKTRPLVK